MRSGPAPHQRPELFGGSCFFSGWEERWRRAMRQVQCQESRPNRGFRVAEKDKERLDREPGVGMLTRMETMTCGTLADGQEVRRFELANGSGLKARILEFGGILESLEAPDREGKSADVTLGQRDFSGWVENAGYFNAIVGRFAGRIDKGRFPLDGTIYQLAVNRVTEHGDCHLHGGEVGLSMRVWKGEGFSQKGGEGVRLRYFSPAGEEGYPGNVDMEVTYLLTEANEFHIQMRAETDAATPLNLASHTYWNLSGDPTTTVLDHEVELAATQFLEIGDSVVPTGAILEVEGTPFDFRKGRPVGQRIEEDHLQLRRGNGYDHYFIFGDGDSSIRPAAVVRDPKSGRILELSTNQAGTVFYTGNFLGEPGTFKGVDRYRKHNGLCLETQGYPDAPNHPHFPSCILRPGMIYRHDMVHRFTTDS